MNTKKLLILIVVLVAGATSVVFWVLYLQQSNISAGWTSYQNRTIGFRISHPREVEILDSYEQTVTLGIPVEGTEEFTDPFPIYMVVSSFSAEGKSLEVVVQEKSGNAREITIAGYKAYQYEIGGSFDTVLHSAIVLAPEPNRMLEISYFIHDPNNQGYEQVVQQMLSSLQVIERGGVSPIAIMLGIGIVVALVFGLGLMFVMRRQ